MELYVTRHGQTEWNGLNRVCGVTDVPLNETGESQARDMAARLVRYGYPITRILCSPLQRARRTAEYAERALLIPCGVDERLREINYGTLEGFDRKGWDFLNHKRQLAARYPGGESAMMAACRAYSLLEEIRDRYPDETFLLVTHNGICRMIHTYFYDLTNDDYFHFNYENCEIHRYEYSR